MSAPDPRNPAASCLSVDWRRAMALHVSNSPRLVSQPGVLGIDQRPAQPVKDRLPARDGRGLRVLRKALRYVYQGILRPLSELCGADNFDCERAQNRNQVVRIDGRGFRILVNRHRMILQLEGQPQQLFHIPSSSSHGSCRSSGAGHR